MSEALKAILKPLAPEGCHCCELCGRPIRDYLEASPCELGWVHQTCEVDQ